MRFVLWGLTCLLVAGLFGASSVRAEKEDEDSTALKKTERSKMYMELGEITVTGKKTNYLYEADVPAAVDVIGSDQIENQNVDFSMELLRKTPGVYYGDWNQGVVSGTVSMRGYDANHDVPVTLIVDGIPHNFGYGRMDIQPFFPLEIERMEVVKGTSDPRYGLSNIAGNVNVHTKNGGDRTQARLLTGSFNTYDGSVLTSKKDNDFTQTYFVGYRQTDGYRQHSDLKKGAASGKWFYTPEHNNLSIGVITRFFGMDANAPGYLTKEQAKENPQQAASFAEADGGEQFNSHVSLHAEYLISENLTWSFKTYTQEIERTRWCRWSDAGTQQERYTDDHQSGAISTFQYETEEIGIDRLGLQWGLDYMHQDNIEKRWYSDNRVRQGDSIRDFDFNQYYWGSYVQADGEINRWLRLVGAVRVDSFGGDFTNRLAETETDMLDMDLIWQPKAGVIVTPADGYSFFANWGRTFQLPSHPQLYGQNSSGDEISRALGESVNDGWDAGIKISPFSWISARVDYWRMTASDEVRSKNDGSGDYINTGETQRKGWDLALTVRPHAWVSVWGSYSIVDAEYTDPGESLIDIKGNDIENIPDRSAKLGADFEHPGGFFGSVSMESQGEYYIDSLNEKEKDGDYTIWNMSLGYKAGSATLGVEIKNLLDENYNAFIWDSEYGYSPGDERSTYVWITIEY
jgi:iron complex outermembrane receptor protein